MNDRDLRRLSRKQLLELLLQLTEKSEELQRQLHEANEKLKSRLVIKSEAGSIAEAALKLNGVFEAAENAAEQYLYNIKKFNDNQEALKKRFEEECLKRAKAMLAETTRLCKERENASREKAKAIIAEAKKEARETESEAAKKLAEIERLYKYVKNEKRKLQKANSDQNKNHG